MPQLRIRFINSNDLIGHGIDYVTNSLFDHCEVITDEGYLGAHLSGGIQLRPFDYCVPTREMRYAFDISNDQAMLMKEYGDQAIGTKYDGLDILGLALHVRTLYDVHHQICSRFVVDYALAGGLPLGNVQPEYTYLVTPELLHFSDAFRGKWYKF